ncbi:MAG TPA: glycosyltransferase [Phycisphaerae bacterium]|nr:glycosyltransferase [Phycisphaerae bacterium]
MTESIRVLFVFGCLLRIGGHLRSALAMARHLISMGHGVAVAASGGVDEMVNAYRDIGATVHFIPELEQYSRLPSRSGAKRLLEIARSERIGLVHAQDFPSIARGYWVAARLGLPFVFTAAGGAFRHNQPPRKTHTIVFSREQYDDLYPNWYRIPPDRLHLIRARIDTSAYHPAPVDADFLARFGLPASGRKLVMAVRLWENKRPWLVSMMDFAEQQALSGVPAQVVIAGEGALLRELKQWAARINSGRRGQIVHLPGAIFGVEDLKSLYNYADVVAGSGRGILEAMACGKAVANLGERGECEVIDEDTIEDAAYYNFSGRHFRARNAPAAAIQQALGELMKDSQRLNRLGQFSLSYIHREMDAGIGAAQLAGVYQKAAGERSKSTDYWRWNLLAARRIAGAILAKRIKQEP